MYIAERIISIAIFLTITFITAIKLSKTNDYKVIKKTLVTFVIILSLLSFFYIPQLSSDLTRLRIMYENRYVGMNFEKYIEILKTTSIYTTHTYYYLISKIGIIELISVFSCIINYSIICYILYDYAKNRNINGFSIANAFLVYIFIGEYVEVVSGFRSMCSFTLFFFCIYREFFKNKTILSDIIFYLLAIGFHNAVVPLVFIRLIYLLFQKFLLNKILRIKSYGKI